MFILLDILELKDNYIALSILLFLYHRKCVIILLCMCKKNIHFFQDLNLYPNPQKLFFKNYCSCLDKGFYRWAKYVSLRFQKKAFCLKEFVSFFPTSPCNILQPFLQVISSMSDYIPQAPEVSFSYWKALPEVDYSLYLALAACYHLENTDTLFYWVIREKEKKTKQGNTEMREKRWGVKEQKIKCLLLQSCAVYNLFFPKHSTVHQSLSIFLAESEKSVIDLIKESWDKVLLCRRKKLQEVFS